MDLDKYLCLLLVIGRNKKLVFCTILDRICGKINEWCNCWLSQGVKVIFIKFVLQAIPNYIMSCFLLPKTFCEEIEGVFVRHWW